MIQSTHNRFCLSEGAPASCAGQQFNVIGTFNFGVDSCSATTTLIPAAADCSGSVLFGLSAGYRLFPPDCTLRTETITPLMPLQMTSLP